jgi:hypothetical protein
MAINILPYSGNITEETLARGLAKAGKRKMGFVFFGQSNEVAAVPISEAATYPQCFYSQNNAAVTSYLPGQAVINKVDATKYMSEGNPWMKFYDDLWDAGFEAIMVNGSVGSAGWVNHAIGTVYAHSTSSTGFWQNRTPVHPSDPGTMGACIVEDNKLFECTTGSELFTYLKNDGGRVFSTDGLSELPYELDYIYFAPNSLKSTASTKPDFTTASAVGDTVTDGAVTWTVTNADASAIGYSTNTQFKMQGRALGGWDALGMMRRAGQLGQQLKTAGCERIFVYVCNGQTDAGQGTTRYQVATGYIVDYFRGLGFEVFLGLSSYGTNATPTNYTDLSTAVANTLAAKSSDDGVHAGADLVNLMGTSPGSNGLALQGDGVHLTAPSAIVAGGHHADAVLSVINA